MQRAELLAMAPRIRAVAAAHGPTNLAASGSVAPDQAGTASVLDLLVDLPPRTGLLDRLALKHELKDLLHCRVDLVRRRSLYPEVLAEAEHDAMPLG